VLLQGQGNAEGAKAANQQAIDSGHAEISYMAMELLDKLR
jgi:hypothetical protein